MATATGRSQTVGPASVTHRNQARTWNKTSSRQPLPHITPMLHMLNLEKPAAYLTTCPSRRDISDCYPPPDSKLCYQAIPAVPAGAPSSDENSSGSLVSAEPSSSFET